MKALPRREFRSKNIAMKEAKPWNRERVIKVMLKIVAACLALFLAAVYLVEYANVFHAHEHCIKNLGTELMIYSTDNAEKFPYHTNGFGDALVLCVKLGK